MCFLFSDISIAQTNNDDTVTSGRLTCTKESRLRWACQLTGNGITAVPDAWTFQPSNVGRIINITNRAKNALALCNPVDFDVRNGELVEMQPGGFRRAQW